jgi:hypothetical protein
MQRLCQTAHPCEFRTGTNVWSTASAASEWGIQGDQRDIEKQAHPPTLDLASPKSRVTRPIKPSSKSS